MQTALQPPRSGWIGGPVDHAQTLHGSGRGNVTIAQRIGDDWREKSVLVQDLAYVVPQLTGQDDVYLTMNRFIGRRRLVTRLLELGALFVDLDQYKFGIEGAPQHVLERARETLDRARLPQPSFAISSGRGLALIWLHRPVPRAALPRWRACQHVLFQALRSLGADRLATDAARVLRLIGTRNSHSGSLVEVITPTGEVWNFDRLADEILPLQRAKLVALRLERARRRGQGRDDVRPSCHFDAADLWERRLAELQQLRQQRWFGPLPDGQRDAWMLLAGTAVGYLVPGPMVRREILALAVEVTGGRWSERETLSRMGSVIRRAEQAAWGECIEHRGRMVDPRYRFRTRTIIELLDITEVEMRAGNFRHLVTPEIRREHERERWHQRRETAGGLSRVVYLEHALSQQRPWEAEEISRRTWERRRAQAVALAVASPSVCMVA